MLRKRCRPTPALFYGYNAVDIALWCGVSRRVALAYKRGERRPSRAAVRLFVLHRDRRVLTPEWERGWVVTPTAIVDPEGNTVPRTWIRGYFLLLQWAHSIAVDRGLVREYRRRLGAIGGQS
jgi:hypothetical protein